MGYLNWPRVHHISSYVGSMLWVIIVRPGPDLVPGTGQRIIGPFLTLFFQELARRTDADEKKSLYFLCDFLRFEADLRRSGRYLETIWEGFVRGL